MRSDPLKAFPHVEVCTFFSLFLFGFLFWFLFVWFTVRSDPLKAFPHVEVCTFFSLFLFGFLFGWFFVLFFVCLVFFCLLSCHPHCCLPYCGQNCPLCGLVVETKTGCSSNKNKRRLHHNGISESYLRWFKGKLDVAFFFFSLFFFFLVFSFSAGAENTLLALPGRNYSKEYATIEEDAVICSSVDHKRAQHRFCTWLFLLTFLHVECCSLGL